MKWEYRVEDVEAPTGSDKAVLINHLNELGDQGWEVVSLSGTGLTPTGKIGYRALLKRPKDEGGEFSFASVRT